VVHSASQDGTWSENGATLLITVSGWSGHSQFKLLVMLVTAVLFGSSLYFLIHRRHREQNPAA